MKNWFKLGERLSNIQNNLLATLGFILIIVSWQLIVTFGGISNTIFPSPLKVIRALYELFASFNLIENTLYSIKLNFYGYLEAILISIPLGFMIGLFPMLNGMFSKWVDSIRFIPLTAVTGIFIGIFGLALDMKVHFLSFGIIIYLLPIFVTRVGEVENVHKQTMWTIGASKWQTFKHLYFPSVMSKIFSDIRVIVAISWTYIIVAELIAKDLGVGALIATSAKQSRTDMVFAVLIVIIVVGYLSDLGFKLLERLLFPYNYEDSQSKMTLSERFMTTMPGKFINKYVLKPKTIES